MIEFTIMNITIFIIVIVLFSLLFSPRLDTSISVGGAGLPVAGQFLKDDGPETVI